MQLNDILHAVDKSVLETLRAFVRYETGFHGDTGIRDYLYYRLMVNFGSGAHIDAEHLGQIYTLAIQAEWHTQLKYLNSKSKPAAPSRGRFDIGVATPELAKASRTPPFAAIECGRNKKPHSLVQNLMAKPEIEDINATDINKLTRELKFARLPYGYALEVYDEKQIGQGERLQQLLAKELASSIELIEPPRLRIAILDIHPGEQARLKLFPPTWERNVLGTPELCQLHEQIHSLRCHCQSTTVRITQDSKLKSARAGKGNITKEDFELRIIDNGVKLLFRKLASEVESIDGIYCRFGTRTWSINEKHGADGRRQLIKLYSDGTYESSDPELAVEYPEVTKGIKAIDATEFGNTVIRLRKKSGKLYTD